MIELPFRVSFTKRQHARSLYRRSNPNSLIGFPSPTFSVPQWNLEELSLYLNSHINTFVSVLILRDLDVCVWSRSTWCADLSWLIFSLVMGSISLCAIFLMIRDVSTSTLFTEFDISP